MNIVNVVVKVEAENLESKEAIAFIEDALPTPDSLTVVVRTKPMNEIIYDALTKEKFRNFYEGPFVEHIQDSRDGPSKDTIMELINELFK